MPPRASAVTRNLIAANTLRVEAKSYIVGLYSLRWRRAACWQCSSEGRVLAPSIFWQNEPIGPIRRRIGRA
jgi:hypothetical protein